MADIDEVAGILAAVRRGDQTAIGRLYALLYPELREQAHRRISRMPNMTMLDTTSLVNESYLRFMKAGSISAADRGHFLAYAAHVMRSVVVDYVRHARTQRRGGEEIQVTLSTDLVDSVGSSGDEVMRLDEFLTQLAAVDERLVKVVEMRYFAASETADIAECLGVTDRTVRRDLEKIRLLLMDARS
jgi:RNA polymerase sigma factor (TIGR02999 family)